MTVVKGRGGIFMRNPNSIGVGWGGSIGDKEYPYKYDTDGLGKLAEYIQGRVNSAGFAWCFSDRYHRTNDYKFLQMIADVQPQLIETMIEALKRAGGLA